MVIDFYYRPKTKLRIGNVFTSVCQEFCPQGRGRCTAPPNKHPLAGRHHPPQHADTPLPLGRHPPEMATAADGTHPTVMHFC